MDIKVTCHPLRHTHIVHAPLRKVPIAAIQKQIGHRGQTATQIYSNFAPEQVREVYETGREQDDRWYKEHAILNVRVRG